MRYWRTTGNSNLATQTGSTYILYLILISWPTVWQISYNSDGKPGFFDQGDLAESVNKWPWHRTTTGNSDVAAKTGNSYTTGTTTDSVVIPTASSGFSTMASPNKVSPSDCDNDRQPEMAMWPPEPETHISETMRDTWTIPTANLGFRPRPARRNWSWWAIATTTDIRKWQYKRFGHQSCNFWSLAQWFG